MSIELSEITPSNNVVRKAISNKPANQKRLTIGQKLEVLRKLDSNVPMTDIAQQYGISRPAIYKIKKNKDKILNFSSNSWSQKCMNRKMIKLPCDEILDEILVSWLSQIRQQGTPISGSLIHESALQINEMLRGSSDFKASKGWIGLFKNRHGIRRRQIHGEKLSAYPNSAATFKEMYKNFIKEQGYLNKNIFKADETGLNWKLLPKRTLASENEDSCPEDEIAKDRISVLLCANSDGSCRLPPLIIGQSRNPRCLKNRVLPVIYTSQKSSWIDRQIFLEWYKNNFIPYVKSQQKCPGKVLLLLDNCPAYPSADVLNTVDPQFRVMFFPPNVTSLIQLMDRSVIERTKRIYRRNLLRRISLAQDRLEDPYSFLKNFNLFDCCNMIALAWQELTQVNLASAWSNLVPLDGNVNNSVSEEEFGMDDPKNSSIFTADEIRRLKNATKTIPGYENVRYESFEDLLEGKLDDLGWEPQNLQETVNTVLTRRKTTMPSHESSSGPENSSIKANVTQGRTATDGLTSHSAEWAIPDNDIDDSAFEYEKLVICNSQKPIKVEMINNKNDNSNNSCDCFASNQQKALNAVATLRHWHLVSTNFNKLDFANDLKALDRIEQRINIINNK